ncbi:hypothetical protein VOLCADRAFT_107562 [Volvox carteri f. nagariensis]|uniref:YchJ-like middle NTF2-like domain-containing protein n=1 Tax=Volvox carteri f. nagariensis TaxID=3068 RepID=D8UEY4_VOLCA|nr:uncharacterized protein VOLCADRAFT_107562 [Volvox carteri f. nagariensis]EFJ41723.1 hypothetical protein VOLCADRAFT_107562 [Volvox carteri f. nagariensis]|eukprot:XP_002957225.1 hypothetical protein VOLCADRAFT_107562 [Volvox carteri f. nagariensis]
MLRTGKTLLGQRTFTQKQVYPRRAHVLVTAGLGFGKKDNVKACPCGSGQDYQACCQRYHKSLTVQAPTAEALLRARFSAYAKREWKYVVRTTHPANPNVKGTVSEDGKVRTTFEEDVKVSMYNCDFVRLQVLGQELGASPREVIIDFQLDIRQKLDEKARKLEKPLPRTIREKALFVLSDDGAWEFLRAVDSNWDRVKLEYRGVEGTAQPAGPRLRRPPDDLLHLALPVVSASSLPPTQPPTVDFRAHRTWARRFVAIFIAHDTSRRPT